MHALMSAFSHGIEKFASHHCPKECRQKIGSKSSDLGGRSGLESKANCTTLEKTKPF